MTKNANYEPKDVIGDLTNNLPKNQVHQIETSSMSHTMAKSQNVMDDQTINQEETQKILYEFEPQEHIQNHQCFYARNVAFPIGNGFNQIMQTANGNIRENDDMTLSSFEL